MYQKLEERKKFEELQHIVKNSGNIPKNNILDSYDKFNDQLRSSEIVTRIQLAGDYEQFIKNKRKQNDFQRNEDIAYGNNLISSAQLSLKHEKQLQNKKLEAYRQAFKEGILEF